MVEPQQATTSWWNRPVTHAEAVIWLICWIVMAPFSKWLALALGVSAK